MAEAKTMMPLRHANVLELLALAVDDEVEEDLKFMLVTPFMENGELGAYLKNNREPKSKVSHIILSYCCD